MSMYQPGALHSFLQGMGASPKKGLSQNFLIDGNIIRKIAQTAHLQPGERVLEIGPGPGALTEELLAQGAHVIAIEKDTTLARALERLQTADHRLTVLCEDALNVDYPTILGSHKPVKVIANLPYHITTPLITTFLPLKDCFSTLVMMVQEEVARRLTSKPKTPDYSSLTVFTHFYSDVRYAFKVSKNCFFPVPKVDSAVVHFQLKQPPIEDAENFFKLTRTAFGQRRKMLRGSLRESFGSEVVTAALEKIGLNPQARPEELDLDHYLKLFSLLQRASKDAR